MSNLGAILFIIGLLILFVLAPWLAGGGGDDCSFAANNGDPMPAHCGGTP